MNDVSSQFVLHISILWSQLFRVSWYVFRLGAFRNKPSWHWVPLNHISVQHLPQNHGLSDTLHPLKINMEPKNHLILKRTIIFHSPPFWGFQPLIFQGPKGMIFPSNMWRFDLRFTATLSQRHGWFAPLLTALSDATGSSSGTLLFLGIEHVLFFICYLGKDIDIHRGSQALLLHRNLT